MAYRSRFKPLQAKRFYMDFELYATPTGRPRISAGFVPSNFCSLPQIDERDNREYGLKIDDPETYAAYKKVEAAVREFTEFLISKGEIEKGRKKN